MNSSSVWQSVPVTLQALWVRGGTYLAQLAFAPVLVAAYGAPGSVWLQYDFPADGAAHSINVTVLMFMKTPTRLAEAMFLRFNPPVADGWWMDKLSGDRRVDPADTVLGGGVHMGAVYAGVGVGNLTVSAAGHRAVSDGPHGLRNDDARGRSLRWTRRL